MSGILVDSNVLLDLFTEDKKWLNWSSRQIAQAAERGPLVINSIIYSEVSVGFEKFETLEAKLRPDIFERRGIPWEAAFLAGKCFFRYRKLGGSKTSPLPDFYIGAHAAVENLTLLTRDQRRYRTYFPKLKMITPEL